MTLDRALADANTQFQQFASDAFGSPQPVLVDDTQDQRNGLNGSLGLQVVAFDLRRHTQ